jgi:hypothetical protein
MNIEDLRWRGYQRSGDTVWFANTEEYIFSVLNRETGYGNKLRDVETGLTDTEDNLWLVSGDFDIRNYPELTIKEAVDKIKREGYEYLKDDPKEDI